jgi:D-alanine-D-alanine ligase
MKVLIIYNLDPIWENHEIKEVRRSGRMIFQSLKKEGIETYIEEVHNPHLEKILEAYDPSDTIVFNLCETLPGLASCTEEKIVEIIENRGFTYTGNKPEVIATSYDKMKVKEILVTLGIDVPYGAVLSMEEADTWKVFPAIVKPSHEHCSLTISEKSVVYNTSELREQIGVVNNELNQSAIVEDFIDGREFHVSVWNNNEPEILPLAEMDFSAFHEARKRLCTYDSKNIPGSEHYEKIEILIPAPLNEQQLKKIEKITLTAWKGFGCLDYARFDFRLRDDKFYLLDVNPNNDISFDTSFALAAEKNNYSYSQMVKRIITMAAERHPKIREELIVQNTFNNVF